MSANVRTFDFGRDVSLPAALDIVEAALEDEGLHLVGREMHGSRIAYAIRFSGSADGSEPSYLRVVIAKKFIRPA